MELDEGDEDQAHGAQGELPGGTSDQDMEDGDTVRVAVVGKSGSTRESFALDSRNDEPSNSITEHGPFSGTRAATPLFVSSREASSGYEIPTPTSSGSSSRQSLNLPEGATFAVVAPPVRRRWEYQTLDDDPRIAHVLKEDNEAGVISYVIGSRDHRKLRVSRSYVSHDIRTLQAMHTLSMSEDLLNLFSYLLPSSYFHTLLTQNSCIRSLSNSYSEFLVDPLP
jgi:hypothetical protein